MNSTGVVTAGGKVTQVCSHLPGDAAGVGLSEQYKRDDSRCHGSLVVQRQVTGRVREGKGCVGSTGEVRIGVFYLPGDWEGLGGIQSGEQYRRCNSRCDGKTGV